jgi:hypothetical protein
VDKEEFDRWEEERRQRHAERQARRAERRRERYGASNPSGRKERVLHTRVSEPLDDAIRRAAEEMRLPVSNLVRNVLEDVFDVVETVTDNVGDLVDDVLGEVDGARSRYRGRMRRARERQQRFDAEEAEISRWEAEAERPTAEPTEERDAESTESEETERQAFPEVLGWQPLILNGEQRCADCGRDLAASDRAFGGITSSGLSQTYLCRDCMSARS